ncbi:MAG: hypothetical protein KatS3mg026_1615 [Bacteroidia bacterium]|nr:MAG: hypothetical protein KatS3mg026_1615 [Bacteroidia bacterium]
MVKEFLRLAGLLVLVGLLLLAGSFLVQGLGLGVSGEPTTQAEAHRAAGGNALLLLLGFGGAGFLYLLLVRPEQGWRLLKGSGGGLALYGWIALFMAGLFLVLPWLGLDAESFRLPSSLSSWEARLEAQEAQIEALMKALIRHGALPVLVVCLAAAPGLAEELFFRGALQTQLSRLMNRHAAVWVTAVLFSLVHFQVYGLLPRALLGVVMGYLTLGSGRLWPAVWAHFLNNFYATVVAYVGLHYLQAPEWVESSYRPPLELAFVGAAIAGLAGYQLYRRLARG